MKDVPAFLINPGDTFTYNGHVYTAMAEPRGEFATYIKVWDPMFAEGADIYLPSGAIVTIEETE